jgi:hypothetical protein
VTGVAAFHLGVWHPFGPHGRETPEQIIERKRREIDLNGWTLWSFQYRRLEVLQTWCLEMAAAEPLTALVLCSDSAGAVDPAEAGTPVGTTDCRSYMSVGAEVWQPFPAGVRVPHPFKGEKGTASAFIVGRILYPVDFVGPAAEWLSKGQWRQDRVPTRGEYLVRPGGTVPLRPVRAVLELRAPYLALVSADQCR